MCEEVGCILNNKNNVSILSFTLFGHGNHHINSELILNLCEYKEDVSIRGARGCCSRVKRGFAIANLYNV